MKSGIFDLDNGALTEGTHYEFKPAVVQFASLSFWERVGVRALRTAGSE